MDPEQVYQEVLQEEQGKGSSGPVAEGRAKAARARAEHGSPHPKEAKWWEGAQPHLEGGDAAPAPEEEAPEEEEVEAAPAAEPPAAEAPAEETPAEPAAAEAPAPAAEPAPAPAAAAAPAATAAPAAAPAVAAPAAVAEAPPMGVTHGTPAGNRMRPEDGVATQAMLDGQQAVYQRRKLIDDLVATGAPAITAEEAGKPRAPFLAILYILIPLIAVLIVVSQDDDGGAEAASGGEAVEHAEGNGETGGGEATGGGGLEIVAENIAFTTNTLELPAGEETTLTFVNNDDGTDHNVAIYENQEDALAKTNGIFVGEIFPGVETVEYEVPALEAGEYYFHCDVHPNMNGTATAS